MALIQQELASREPWQRPLLSGRGQQLAECIFLIPCSLAPLFPCPLVSSFSRSLFPCFSRQSNMRMKRPRLRNESTLARRRHYVLLQSGQPRRHRHIDEQYSRPFKRSKLAQFHSHRRAAYFVQPRLQALQLLRSRIPQKLQRNVPRLRLAPTQPIYPPATFTPAQSRNHRRKLPRNRIRQRNSHKQPHTEPVYDLRSGAETSYPIISVIKSRTDELSFPCGWPRCLAFGRLGQCRPTACRESSVLKGHDFSRAASCAK